MQQLTSNDVLPDDGGMKLININPGEGSCEIFKSNPGGTYPETPFKTITQSSDPKDFIFYAPTPKGLYWRVVLTGGATAEYTKHSTRNY